MTTIETIKVSPSKVVRIQADRSDIYYVSLLQTYNNETDVLRTRCYGTLKGAQRFATTLKNRG